MLNTFFTSNLLRNSLFTIILFSLFLFISTSSTVSDQKPIVENVDLNRYVGTWYEIARFPHWFEKNLVGVTATYEIIDDIRIKVKNQGYKQTLDGDLKVAIGKAKVSDPKQTGHLRVSFFLFFYSDYYILDLDRENYKYALVGSSSDDYLWILCREPVMDRDVYDKLVNKAAELGYDVSRLEKVVQK